MQFSLKYETIKIKKQEIQGRIALENPIRFNKFSFLSQKEEAFTWKS